MEEVAITESGIELNLRKLNTGDLFRAARMIKKLGIKEEIKNITNEVTEKTEKENTKTGIELIFSIFEVFTSNEAETELYEFISKPLGIAPAQVEKLELERLAEAILKVADVEKWNVFFSQVVHLK